jgi:hypothetical protein
MEFSLEMFAVLMENTTKHGMEVGISNKNVVLNGNPLIRKSEFKGW